MQESQIWIQTSLVEQNASKAKRLNNDSFMEEEEHHSNDWGWMKGCIIQDNEESNTLTIRITDDESIFIGTEVIISNKELQNGVVIANIHNIHNGETLTNDYYTSSSSTSSLESSLDKEEENFQTSYPNDLTNLIHLHEPAILHVLRRRYENDIIYTTASDTILVALNPFKYCEDLYSTQRMKLYYEDRGKELQLPPHVFSIADNAYCRMIDVDYVDNVDVEKLKLKGGSGSGSGVCDQSILVSGESGAGKTVSTKYIMKYLATLSQFGEDAASSNQVEQQVLQSNPILESFGNARTVRNDNSSRFGKFIEIQFQSSSLTGASIETYLLEKVRLITQSYNERNFHIFYEILSGFSEEQREEYFIFDKHYEDFNMLNQGVEDRRDGVEDEDTFQELMNAFESLDGTGFTHQNIKDIFTVTCLCLHLSNVQVIPNVNNTNEDGSSIQTEEHLKAVLELLGVSYDQFNTAICYFSIVAGKEHHKRCRNVLKAQRAIHGLIKACYASLFTFLVQRINSSFVSSSSSSSSTTTTATRRKKKNKAASFIGILDIFGFESFEQNSFEQLCINYCNEALQNQFNTFVFQQEQVLYKAEGIDWSFITFPDNTHVLKLLDCKLYSSDTTTTTNTNTKHGFFQILDDQCRAPGTSDKSFATELYRKIKNEAFVADHRQVGTNKFSVRHYAGLVEYDINSGFVEKNKDEVPKETTELLDCSRNGFYAVLAGILKNQAVSKIASPRGHSRKSNSSSLPSKTTKTTTGYQFRSQLQNLLNKIQTTTPHYIRCIKPNDSLTPDNFDCKRIVEQLRCAGVVEAIRISRSGYPYRYNHVAFFNSYKILAWKELNLKKQSSVTTPRKSKKSGSLEILITTIRNQILEYEHEKEVSITTEEINNSIQIGKSKIFCNTLAYDYIQKTHKRLITSSTILIQSHIRRYMAVQRYKALLQQILQENNAATILQKYWRMYTCCDLYYKKVLYVILYLQRVYRGKKQRKIYQKMLSISRSIKLQSCIRMLLSYHSFLRKKTKVVVLQCAYRCYRARVALCTLKNDAKDIQKVFQERNVLQQEKLVLMNELKEYKEMLAAMQQKPSKQEHDTISINSMQEQEKIITQVTNILSQQLLTSIVQENEHLRQEQNSNTKIYNDYIRVKEDAKKLKDSLMESKLSQEKLEKEIVLMQERDTKIVNNHNTEERMDTSETITALQNEIKKLKERDAINTLQLEKLSKHHQTQYPQQDDSDDESSHCSSYEERIIAANAVYNDDSPSSFFLDKEPFIPPDIFLPIQKEEEDVVTTSTSSKKNFIHKFNNDELSQYDDLSLGFHTITVVNEDHKSTNFNKSVTSNYNQLNQTTKYSDLRGGTSSILSNKLPIIHSSSEQSLEQSSTTASCITALTNQLDIANDEIANLKAKLIYYKKDRKKRKNTDKDDTYDSDDSIGFSTTASSTTTSGIVDQHEDEHSEDNKRKVLSDDGDMIKSDIPRSIEVDVSSKCERLEQQIAHLERRLDNMSLVSSSRKSRTSSKHSSLSHGNNSIFSDDDILSFRERATRSTVAVDDISFSVPSSINNEQVIHQLLSDNDFIRDAVRNHMDEYARNHTNYPQERKREEPVTYPAMSCSMGRFFRSFVRKSGGDSAQSAYSSAYMR